MDEGLDESAQRWVPYSAQVRLRRAEQVGGQARIGEEHRVQVCEVVLGGGTVKVGRADLGEVAYVPVDDRGEVAVIPGAPRDPRSQAA